MALEPLLSLTPLNPFHYGYDPENPDAPHAYGYLATFGGFTYDSVPLSLAGQHANDEIILGIDPVDPSDETIGSIIDDLYRRCTARVIFSGSNVTTENQYLLLFALRSTSAVTAQFFVGTELVRAEEIDGDEQVAILLDVPGDNQSVSVYVRLASVMFNARLGFRGMDCYLL